MPALGLGLGLSARRGGFSLASIPGWQVILDATTLSQGYGEGDSIGEWPDISGSGRHASQADSDKQPVFSAAVPGVRCDGIDDFLELGDLSGLVPTAATLFIVATINDSNGNYSLYEHGLVGNDGWWRYGVNGLSYPAMFRNLRLEMATDQMPTSGRHIFCVTSSASSYKIHLDGVEIVSAAGNYAAGTQHTMGVNPASPASMAFGGDYHHVLLNSSALSDATGAAVDAWLAAKWGISI